MKEICDFLKECGTFYLATEEEGQPRVRPFGAFCEFEGKLYLVTNNQKKVYQQMRKNARVELCATKGGQWLRIEAVVKEDLRREARVAMMESNPSLGSMYSVDDGLMTVFYVEQGKAMLYALGGQEPKELAL